MDHNIALIGFLECVKVCVEVISCKSNRHTVMKLCINGSLIISTLYTLDHNIVLTGLSECVQICIEVISCI